MATVYVIYAAIGLTLTIWVGRTLFVNGAPFLVQVFRGDVRRAAAVNKLLLVGFCLVNLGLVSLHLQERNTFPDLQQQIELVAAKVGGTLLILGFMHGCNLFFLCFIREWVAAQSFSNAGDRQA